MNRQKLNGPDCIPVTAAGVSAEPSGKDANTAGYTLVTGTTYYYYLGVSMKEAPYQSVQVKWDNAAILTITIEDTDFHDVTNYSATAGDWQKEDPSSAYVAANGGATVTNATVAVPGGTAGGCLYHLSLAGSLRSRLKIVVGGTGGVVRVATHAKD